MADPTEFERSPRIEAAHLRKLQDALNDRAIVGVSQPKTSTHICAHRFIRGDRLIGCSDLAAYHHVEETPCTECGKTKKEADEPFCLAHMALKICGLIRNVQTTFDEVDRHTHAAPAASEHDDQSGGTEGDDEREIVLDGKTGAPISCEPIPARNGEKHMLLPSVENPGECVCGWALEAKIVGHDRRHEQYVNSIEHDPVPADAAAERHVTKPKRAGAKKKTQAPNPKRKARA